MTREGWSEKATPAQLQRRREKVVELTRARYSIAQIAEALGVAETLVGSDRIAMRKYLRDIPKRTYLTPTPEVPPEPYDWRSEPAVTIPPWQQTSPVRVVAACLAQLRDINARNRLAFNVAEAHRERDEEWYASAQVTLAEAEAMISDMRKILTSAQARRAAVTTGRDDLRRISSAGGAGVRLKPMPPKGSRVKPTRMFSEIWRRDWAGIEVDAGEITAIARMEGTTTDRVEEAIIAYRKAKAEAGN